MYLLTEHESWLCQQIVDSAFKVHTTLGPGLLEKIYEACFCHELKKRNIMYERQPFVCINYDGLLFEEGLRMDVMVEQLICCELKAIETVNPLWEAQLLTQLKLTGKHVGFLINFNEVLLKDGFKRKVNNYKED